MRTGVLIIGVMSINILNIKKENGRHRMKKYMGYGNIVLNISMGQLGNSEEHAYKKLNDLVNEITTEFQLFVKDKLEDIELKINDCESVEWQEVREVEEIKKKSHQVMRTQ